MKGLPGTEKRIRASVVCFVISVAVLAVVVAGPHNYDHTQLLSVPIPMPYTHYPFGFPPGSPRVRLFVLK